MSTYAEKMEMNDQPTTLTLELLRLAAALDDDDNPVAFDGNLARNAALEIETLRRLISDSTSRIAELEHRLEINPEAAPYDGISCRDETIRLLDGRVAALVKERDELRNYLCTTLTIYKEAIGDGDALRTRLATAVKDAERYRVLMMLCRSGKVNDFIDAEIAARAEEFSPCKCRAVCRTPEQCAHLEFCNKSWPTASYKDIPLEAPK